MDNQEQEFAFRLRMEQEAAAAAQAHSFSPSTVQEEGVGPLQTIGRLAASGISHVLTPMAAGAAGLAGLPFGKSDQWRQAVSDTTYQTPEGSDARAVTDQLTSFIGGTPGLSQLGHGINVMDKSVDDFVGKYGGPDAQAALRRAGKVSEDITNVAPLVGTAAQGVRALRAASAAAEANASAARTTDELARAAGLKMRPSDMEAATGATKPGAGAHLREAVGGSQELRRDYVLHNKPRITEIVTDEAGVPRGTHPANIEKELTAAEAPHAEVYRRVEDALHEPVVFDSEFKADIAKAGERKDSLRPDPEGVESERKGALTMTQGTGREMKATIANYRKEGYRNLKSETDTQWAKGAAQLDIANALEAQMQRALERAGHEGLAFDYQRAREGFARINTARESLVGLDIDPKVMARLADNNPGIGGGMRLVADLARQAPDVITSKVPAVTNMTRAHGLLATGLGGLGFGAGYMMGGPVGGAFGSAGGLALSPIIRGAVRRSMSTAAGRAAPKDALAFAMADRMPERVTGGFSPSQGPGFRKPGSPGYRSTSTAVAPIAGRDYTPQHRPLDDATPMPNEGLNPADRALAEAMAAQHPGIPRPAPSRPLLLPAPGELAPRPAIARDASTMSDAEQLALAAAQRSRPAMAIDEGIGTGEPTPNRGTLPDIAGPSRVLQQPSTLRITTTPAGGRKLHTTGGVSSLSPEDERDFVALAKRKGEAVQRRLEGKPEGLKTLTKAERALVDRAARDRAQSLPEDMN